MIPLLLDLAMWLLVWLAASVVLVALLSATVLGWGRSRDRHEARRLSALDSEPDGRAIAIAEYQRRVDATRRQRRGGAA